METREGDSDCGRPLAAPPNRRTHTCTRTGHTLDNKTALGKFRRTEILKRMSADHKAAEQRDIRTIPKYLETT